MSKIPQIWLNMWRFLKGDIVKVWTVGNKQYVLRKQQWD